MGPPPQTTSPETVASTSASRSKADRSGRVVGPREAQQLELQLLGGQNARPADCTALRPMHSAALVVMN